MKVRVINDSRFDGPVDAKRFSQLKKKEIKKNHLSPEIFSSNDLFLVNTRWTGSLEYVTRGEVEIVK